jgi:hypothetical protein
MPAGALAPAPPCAAARVLEPPLPPPLAAAAAPAPALFVFVLALAPASAAAVGGGVVLEPGAMPSREPPPHAASSASTLHPQPHPRIDPALRMRSLCMRPTKKARENPNAFVTQS